MCCPCMGSQEAPSCKANTVHIKLKTVDHAAVARSQLVVASNMAVALQQVSHH